LPPQAGADFFLGGLSTAMNLADRPIGEYLNPVQLRNLYPAIVGGISWPSNERGYAVVLGVGRDTLNAPWVAYVIAEAEEADITDLIRHCCLLDLQFAPDRWIANWENDAAFLTMGEVNKQYADEHGSAWRGLKASKPLILEHKRPYEYIMPKILDRLKVGQERLVLKNSLAYQRLFQLDDLDKPDVKRLPEMKWGDYPHIEALAFALLEVFRIHDSTRRGRRETRKKHPMHC